MSELHALSISMAVVVLVITGVVGVTVFGAVADNTNQENYTAFEEYCDERGGELYNAQAIAHGGLHCDLPNGTIVHMHEVENAGGGSA